MKKIIKSGIILVLYCFMCMQINIVTAQSISNEISNEKFKYLAAWTSLAVYNDKISVLARDVLEENGWQINVQNEKIVNSDVKYLLANKHFDNNNVLFLSISGTSSWEDVKTDLSVEAVNFGGKNINEFITTMKNEQLLKDNPLVHKGFLKYVQDGFFTPNTNNEILGIKIKEHLKNNPQDKIYITGHSLGGAVAELLTARLLDMGVNKDQIVTITFGAPAVGNKAFVEQYEPKMNLTRITMKGDVVKNLAQIANERFVQFKNNEEWSITQNDNDKFAHNMLLYFDRAMRNYYDIYGNELKNQMQNKTQCEYYVVAPKYNFPKEIQSEINYINLALTDKMLKKKQVCFMEDSLNVDAFSRAKALGAKYVIFYEYSADKLKDTTSNKRYYINAAKYVYDINGNLIQGESINTDTNQMTILQAVLYANSQF